MTRSYRPFTRRQFVKGATLAGAGVIVAACQPKPAAPATLAPTAAKAPETKAPATPGKVAQAGACVVTPVGTYPVTQDKVTLTAFSLQDPLCENLETNLLTVEYEARTNVHINWQLAPAAGMAEKRNLLFASGSYPDIFIAASIPREDQMTYGSQGVLIALNQLIDAYAPNVKKTYEDLPLLRDAVTAPDGTIYALGVDQRCFHCSLQQRMWINKKFLDKLGLKMPGTTDEFYEVLKAFRDKDPNGNGKADELPLVGANAFPYYVHGNLMNAFVYNDSKERLILDAGKIGASYNQPGWREGLEYLRKLYAEKLIEPASLTRPQADLKKICDQEGDPVMGACFYSPNAFCNPGGTRLNDYDPVPPLKGPKGVQLAAWYPYNAAVGCFAISKTCKCPEVAMRWVDWFYTWEGAVRSRIGREGEQFEWRRAKEGELGLDGKQALWIKVKPIGIAQNYFWGQGPWPQQFDHSSQSACDNIYEACGMERRWYAAAKLYEPYKPKEVVPPLWVPKEKNSRLAQLQTEISDYVLESSARFVTGDLNVQNDWDKYTKTLNDMGLAEYLSILQSAYDQKYKK